MTIKNVRMKVWLKCAILFRPISDFIYAFKSVQVDLQRSRNKVTVTFSLSTLLKLNFFLLDLNNNSVKIQDCSLTTTHSVRLVTVLIFSYPVRFRSVFSEKPKIQFFFRFRF